MTHKRKRETWDELENWRKENSEKFDIIYLDPPWPYTINPGGGGMGVVNHYDTVTMASLKKLPINDLLNDEHGCVLMWTTAPFLSQAVSLMKAWGITYKTVWQTWVKTDGEKLQWHFGYYAKMNPEFLLIGTKGKFWRFIKGRPKVSSITMEEEVYDEVLLEPRREHSRKPASLYKKIEDAFGDCKRLELFARNEREGWKSWGNETNKFTKN